MDKEEKLIAGLSAAAGCTSSSRTTESMAVKNDILDDMEMNVKKAVPQHTDTFTDEPDDLLTTMPPSTNEESVVKIVPPKEDTQPISPEDIIIEPVMYGGPILDDLVAIDIDSDMYGGPVEDILIIDPDVIDDDLKIDPDEFIIDFDSKVYENPVEDIEHTMNGGSKSESKKTMDIDSDIYEGTVDKI